MDELRFLKWFFLLVALVVSSAATIFVPTLVALFALVVLVVGVIWYLSSRGRNGHVATTIAAVGIAFLVPPICYIALGLLRSGR